jgi:hypothetical protein
MLTLLSLQHLAYPAYLPEMFSELGENLEQLAAAVSAQVAVGYGFDVFRVGGVCEE